MSKTLPVAVQVYSVRDDAQKDFKGTMAAIKQMGYDGVELAGLYDLEPAYIRQVLDELELPAISAHVPFVELIEDAEGTIDKYITIGCQYIAVPYLTEEMRPGTDGYATTLAEIRRIGAVCNAKVVTLLYHNHDFEFVKLDNGAFALDDMYATIPADLLQTELDTCWVKVAGQCPVAYINKYAHRCPVVHLKDFYKEGVPANMYELIGMEEEKKQATGVFEFRPVGHGLQDFPPILQAAVDAGAKWVVVEQDMSVGRTPMEAIRMSREYLRSQGW